MPTVSYRHHFPYLTGSGGGRVPALLLVMRLPERGLAIRLDAQVDSGASLSLFDGSLLPPIGAHLLDGEPVRFEGTSGAAMDARIHDVELVHRSLGRFRLRVAFSLGAIRRNLLGRDFFNLTQIGFRERQLTLFIQPTP